RTPEGSAAAFTARALLWAPSSSRLAVPMVGATGSSRGRGCSRTPANLVGRGIKNMSWRSLVCFALLAASAACGDLPPPPVGQLRLSLSSGIGELHYRLAHATFAIEGAA